MSPSQRQQQPRPANVNAIIAGDPAALNHWFERESDPLYAFVFHRVGKDPDLTADVVQTTMSKALTRLRDFDPERGTMSTWLRMLSRNIIRDTLRAPRVEVSLEAYWTRVDDRLRSFYNAIDTSDIPGEVLERSETRELVGVAIANLPEEAKNMLTDKYIEERSIADMARQYQTTEDAIKSRLRRARTAFRETFLALVPAQS